MKVSELIEALQEFDGDLEVIAGSDEEGNDFNDLYYPSLNWCAPDDSMRCGWNPLHPSDVGTEYDIEDDQLEQKVVF